MRQLIQNFIAQQQKKQAIRQNFISQRQLWLEKSLEVQHKLHDELQRKGWSYPDNFNVEHGQFLATTECFAAMLSEPLYTEFFKPYLEHFGRLDGLYGIYNNLFMPYSPYSEQNRSGAAEFMLYQSK